VTFPIPPTAGSPVSDPWLICAFPWYVTSDAGPGTFAVTRFDAENSIGRFVGFTTRTVTDSTVVWPTVGVCAPDT
jgi:hypothetical protein